MRPLEYKYIGEERHLTYDSIRRLVLKELSNLGEAEALEHISQCPRCRSIQHSLAYPAESRKSSLSYQIPKVWWIAALLVSLTGMVLAAVYFLKDQSQPVSEVMEMEVPPGDLGTVDELPDQTEEVAPVLEAIDTMSEITDEPPTLPDPVSPNKKFDDYIEQPKNQVQNRLRGIYGKITNDGQPVSGVTVMTPGSNTARISDHNGKYYIQVSTRTKSLIFIYQGKQVVKSIDPNSRRLDLQLNIEEMSYPSRPEQRP